jgi:hypothetical protein
VLTGLRVRQLPEHRAALEKAGFVLRERRTWLGGLLVAEMWTARQLRTGAEILDFPNRGQ